MLFNFGLFPFSELISEIERSEGERSRAPHWYRLSNGWYWLDVGETRLFRYTRGVGELWQPRRTASDLYVDYYLSAFFRDLLECLPAMLEPIPAALAERLSSIGEWNDWMAARDEWRGVKRRRILMMKQWKRVSSIQWSTWWSRLPGPLQRLFGPAS